MNTRTHTPGTKVPDTVPDADAGWDVIEPCDGIEALSVPRPKSSMGGLAMERHPTVGSPNLAGEDLPPNDLDGLDGLRGPGKA